MTVVPQATIMAGWFGWLRNVFSRARGRAPSARLGRHGKPRHWDRYLLHLERLEDRLAPANVINVMVGAAGSGQLDHLLNPSNGTIRMSDDPGTTETLSTGALASVGAGVDISVAAATSISFADVGMLKLQTAAGHSVAFTANNGTIAFANMANTIATSGAALAFTSGAGLSAANLDTGTGGNVALNAGSAGMGDLVFESIATNGVGNLTLQASGAITQNGAASTALGGTIDATATGNVLLNALAGITVTVTSGLGSIASSGAGAVQANEQLTLAAATGINLNTLAASLQASNTTEGAIHITQLASPATNLAIDGSGVVNSAAGSGISIVNLGGSVTVNNGSSGVGIQSKNGAVVVEGTDLNIVGSIVSGTASTTLGSSVAGAAINLGGGSGSPGTLTLTQTELNQIAAGELLVGAATAGSISVTAAITNAGTGWTTLGLLSGSTITEPAGGALNVTALRIDAAGTGTLTSVNNVGTLAASVTNAFAFSNGPNPLSVDT